MAKSLNAYQNGLNKIEYYTGLPPSGRAAKGETISIMNGKEVTNDIAWPEGGTGTKSNVYLKINRPLKAIESTFRHELVHTSDMFSGMTTDFYNSQASNALWRTKIWSEINAYRINVKFGYRKSYYTKRLNEYLNGWRVRYGTDFPY